MLLEEESAAGLLILSASEPIMVPPTRLSMSGSPSSP